MSENDNKIANMSNRRLRIEPSSYTRYRVG